MESWFVQPIPKRIPLSDGQWILIKTRLTAGEYRAHLRRSQAVDATGEVIQPARVDPYNHALSQVVSYLLDWSLDYDIRGASPADLVKAVDGLDVLRFGEIRTAIERHERAMQAEREQEKKTSTGETTSAPISPSPSAGDVPSNMSAALT